MASNGTDLRVRVEAFPGLVGLLGYLGQLSFVAGERDPGFTFRRTGAAGFEGQFAPLPVRVGFHLSRPIARGEKALNRFLGRRRKRDTLNWHGLYLRSIAHEFGRAHGCGRGTTKNDENKKAFERAH